MATAGTRHAIPIDEVDYVRAWKAAEQMFVLLEIDGRIGVRKLPDSTCQVFLTAPSSDLNAYSSRVSAHGVTLPHTVEGGTGMPRKLCSAIGDAI